MSQHSFDHGGCEVMQVDLAELALGILPGRERADVLAHLESCDRCAAELESLSAAADALLMLAPEVEPPLGFESRLSLRLGDFNRRGRSRRLGRLGVFAVAAVFMVVAAFGVGTWITTDAKVPPHQPTAITSSLTSHGNDVGLVVLSTNGPTWMLVTLESTKWQGYVSCTVTLRDGRTMGVGWFNLSGKYSAWVARLKIPVNEVTTARIVAANGTLIASARIAV